MTESLVLDVLLALLLIAYLLYGFRNGLVRSAFVIAGIVAGVIGAYFLVPLISSWVPWPPARPIVVVVSALVLVGIGSAIGSAIGRGLRRGLEKSPLSGIDRFFGGIVTGIAAALIAIVVSASVAPLGVPVLSRAIAGSAVLRTLSNVTPDPVETWLAEVRGVVVDRGLPIIAGIFDGPTPSIPTDIDTGNAALNAAAQSVVRITGNAYACGVQQTGTGFVVADDRIVTNAHVLAGVTEPVIEAPSGETLPGRVVYFDPTDDLAVIAVPGLSTAALPLADTLAVGENAAVQGYPYGGPFTSGAASIVAVNSPPVQNIYNSSSAPRDVYTLAADVREGNSGGPLLTLDGAVAGVIFARSADTANVGFAVTMAELDPVADQAAALSTAVGTGDCID